jgi:hypothetical protein
MPTIAHGFSSIMGAGEEVTLGTPVAATQKVCYIEESIDETINEILDNSLCGTAARSIGQSGTRIIEGGFSFPLRVDTQDLILKRFFGVLSIDTPGAGTNTYELQNEIDGEGLTIAIDKTISVFEWSGYKTSSFTMTGNPSDGIVIAADGFAKSLDLSSVLNTSATLAALGEPGFFYTFQNAVVRIGDLVDALAAGDAFEISDFSIELNRGLEPVEVNAQDRTEALENAFRESTFTITVPQYQSDFFIDAHRAHTSLQCDIVMTNGSNSKSVFMPLLIVTDYSANVGGPEFVTHEVTMQIIPDPGGSNAFMTLQNTASELEIQET